MAGPCTGTVGVSPLLRLPYVNIARAATRDANAAEPHDTVLSPPADMRRLAPLLAVVRGCQVRPAYSHGKVALRQLWTPRR